MVTLLITSNKRNRKSKIFVLTFIQHFSKHIRSSRHIFLSFSATAQLYGLKFNVTSNGIIAHKTTIHTLLSLLNISLSFDRNCLYFV